MKLFLDTSVLLAASGSGTGASREIFHRSSANDWLLIATPYTIQEVLRNLPGLSPAATTDWVHLRTRLLIMDDVLTLDRPAAFGPAQDRPILFSALAWADVLLTLDRDDFGLLLDTAFYGLWILKPGSFLARERAAGLLKPAREP